MLKKQYVCSQIDSLRNSRFLSISGRRDTKRASKAALGVSKKLGRSYKGMSEREEGLVTRNLTLTHNPTSGTK